MLARKQKTYQLLDADDDDNDDDDDDDGDDGAGGIDDKSLIATTSDRHKKRFRKKIESEEDEGDEVECLYSYCHNSFFLFITVSCLSMSVLTAFFCSDQMQCCRWSNKRKKQDGLKDGLPHMKKMMMMMVILRYAFVVQMPCIN